MFDIQNTKYGTVYAIRVARIPDVTISFYVMYLFSVHFEKCYFDV